MVKSDKCIGVSQLLGVHARAAPPKSKHMSASCKVDGNPMAGSTGERGLDIGDSYFFSLLCVALLFDVKTLLEINGIGSKSAPHRAEIWFEISATPAPSGQLSSDEYTDRTASVGRRDREADITGHPHILCRR